MTVREANEYSACVAGFIISVFVLVWGVGMLVLVLKARSIQ